MADYLTVAEVYRMQYRLIELFGGIHGVRDKAAVEAAVFRPQAGYYNSIEEEATALMESLGNNHGFLDGNKRIAFMAMMGFLLKNGVAFDPEPAQSTAMIISLAAGEVSEESLTRWIRDNWPPEASKPEGAAGA